MLCSWGQRGFIGLFSAGNGIPMLDYFIRWFWAGFAAVAAPSSIIFFYKNTLYSFNTIIITNSFLL
jgi:hypothetical protein